MKRITSYFIVAMLIFGSNRVRASMLDMSGAQLCSCRTLIGGAVLLIIISYRPQPGRLGR